MAHSGNTLTWAPCSDIIGDPFVTMETAIYICHSLILYIQHCWLSLSSHSLCSQMPATAFQSPTIWRGSTLSDVRRREQCFRSMHAVIQDIWPKLEHRHALCRVMTTGKSQKESKQEKDADFLFSSQAFPTIPASLFCCALPVKSIVLLFLSAPFLRALRPVCVCECLCGLSALWHLAWPIFPLVYHLTS